MTLLLAVAMFTVLLAAVGAVWIIHSVYERTITALSADNLDLRNRLFISKGQAPTGVNVTAQYEEKQEEKKASTERIAATGRKSPAPLAKWRDTVAAKDRAQADNGLDLTSGKHKAN